MVDGLNDKTLDLEQVFEDFGPYLFLKKLASGGMAEVFLARPNSHLANGRLQVVKRILPHVANNPLFLKMFQTEIQIILGFNHPHTIQLHDFGKFVNQPYISMEYIEGKNLKEIICHFLLRREYIPVPMVLSLITQAAAGLSYAHTFVNQVTGETVNAVHRDVSPHNLIVSYGGNLKVIDFGIAKAVNSSLEATLAGTLKGKLAYLAPEQIRGETIDARSDIFSLAVVAWELLTLRKPFCDEGDSDIKVLEKIHNCDSQIRKPSYYNIGVSKEIDTLLLMALKKNPDERFCSAQQFQVAIRDIMQTQYAGYSYSENSRILKSVFKDEIERENSDIRELNRKAQSQLLAKKLSDESEKEKLRSRTHFKTDLRFDITQYSKTLNLRLQSIEKSMKTKMSNWQYFLLAVYLLSLAFIKYDEDIGFSKLLSAKSKITTRTPMAPVKEKKELRKLKPNSR